MPILVGATDQATERQYGKIMAPYLADPSSVFIISSDFCHWGSRFRYTYYEPALESGLPTQHSLRGRGSSKFKENNELSAAMRERPIFESIAAVDGKCMDAIEAGSHEMFLKILGETGNTVCGRHPIGIVMAAMEELERDRRDSGAEEKNREQERFRFRFVRYERSSDVVDIEDSSVSYCCAFAVL